MNSSCLLPDHNFYSKTAYLWNRHKSLVIKIHIILDRRLEQLHTDPGGSQQQTMSFAPEWGKVNTLVVDYLDMRNDVDKGRLALRVNKISTLAA